MIASQLEIDAIRNSKVRRRTLHRPMLKGRHGELKKCPVDRCSVRTLKPPIPHGRYRAQAEEQPTRARAVLWLIDRCNDPLTTVTITVLNVKRDEEAQE